MSRFCDPLEGKILKAIKRSVFLSGGVATSFLSTANTSTADLRIPTELVTAKDTAIKRSEFYQ
eukprot:scaffold1727_cov133-Cylindrotheca_fusiformis.AAC.10